MPNTAVPGPADQNPAKAVAAAAAVIASDQKKVKSQSIEEKRKKVVCETLIAVTDIRGTISIIRRNRRGSRQNPGLVPTYVTPHCSYSSSSINATVVDLAVGTATASPLRVIMCCTQLRGQEQE